MDRVRWDNVARAAAVLAVAALVVEWPRLKPREPALPPAGAQAVTVEDPRVAARPGLGGRTGGGRAGTSGEAHGPRPDGEDGVGAGDERRVGPVGERPGGGTGPGAERRRVVPPPAARVPPRTARPPTRAAPPPPPARPAPPPPDQDDVAAREFGLP